MVNCVQCCAAARFPTGSWLLGQIWVLVTGNRCSSFLNFIMISILWVILLVLSCFWRKWMYFFFHLLITILWFWNHRWSSSEVHCLCAAFSFSAPPSNHNRVRGSFRWVHERKHLFSWLPQSSINKPRLWMANKSSHRLPNPIWYCDNRLRSKVKKKCCSLCRFHWMPC